ncbi:MAG: VTT domain-containing protein [Phycisphaerales bacterium]
MFEQLLQLLKDPLQTMQKVADTYPAGVYGVLFAIVFCETGLVVTPFLPGDSLFFAVGALCGMGVLKLHVAAPVLFLGAVLGNTSNYWIGRSTGPVIFRGESASLLSRLVSRKHLQTAHSFYERHGGKAVIMGQFVPIVRTFVPYVAGAGAMNYSRFVLFNIVGAALWVGVCVGAGRLFGQLEVVRKNFELVVLGIIAVSVVPILVQFVRSKYFSSKSATVAAASPP